MPVEGRERVHSAGTAGCEGMIEEQEEHDAGIRKEMAKTISEILDHEWMCSLNEIKYILDCVANGNADPFKDRPEKGVEK